MMGTADIDYSRIMMELDSATGEYGDLAGQTKGHKLAMLDYRKMQNLEIDPRLLDYLQRPLFERICARIYGADTPVACFRAMFMNKPAGQGRYLQWHQDRFHGFDRDPQITIWTALDPSIIANGCLHIVPASHTELINPEHGSGFLTEEQMQELQLDDKAIPLEMAAGEVVLLHNWLLHSSDVNNTDTARRAFSVCYMDGRTVSERGVFNTVFGEGALTADTVQFASVDNG